MLRVENTVFPPNYPPQAVAAYSLLQNMAAKVNAAFQDRLFIGPSLRFEGQDERLWKVSMMLVSSSGVPPSVQLKQEGEYLEIPATLIEKNEGYCFYRYNFLSVLSDEPGKASYKIGSKKFTYCVPSFLGASNIMVASCNGIQSVKEEEKHEERGGLLRMWRAALALRFDLLALIGDQIYADGLEEVEELETGERHEVLTGIFELPSIKAWLKLCEKDRANAPFTEEMHQEVRLFYLWKYLLHFFNNGAFSEALATIPTLMQSGDHDFYDGVGSYPKEFQDTEVMRGIFETGKCAFMLFQQHTAAGEDYFDRGFINDKGSSYFRSVDNGKLCILCLDTRTERTESRIISEETLDDAFRRLEEMPAACEHLVVILEVPLVYPSLRLLGEGVELIEGEGMMKKLVRTFLGRVPGLLGISGDSFELRDDIDDQWSAKRHVEEREKIITRLQKVAEGKGLRITIVGGDAHWAAAGMVGPPEAQHSDPRALYQLITSAVVNSPPSELAGLFSLGMNRMNERYTSNSYGRMIPTEKEGQNLDEKRKWKLLHDKRNFGSLFRGGNSTLFWRLYVEPKHGDRITEISSYKLVIPPVMLEQDQGQGQGPALTSDSEVSFESEKESQTPLRSDFEASAEPAKRRGTPYAKTPGRIRPRLMRHNKEDSIESPPISTKKACCIIL